MYNSTLIFVLLLISISCNTHLENTHVGNSKTPSISKEVTAIKTVFDNNAPSRITRNIKLDNAGNLLIASYDDVIRYDGTTFSRLNKPESLESWYAFDALQDVNGNIWIASDQEGAFKIDSKSGEITNFLVEDGLGSRRNMCIYEDQSGNIWIGGQGGLTKYDGENFTNYTTKNGLPHNDINTLLEDKKGNLWVGTRGNAALFDGNTFKELKSRNGNSFFNVWSIIEDYNENIWLVDSSGLWQYNGKEFTQKADDIWKVYQNSEGDFWFTGMLPGGSSKLMYQEQNILEHIVPQEVLKSQKMLFGIIEDKDKHMWIGGGDGIWQYDGEQATYFTSKQPEKLY